MKTNLLNMASGAASACLVVSAIASLAVAQTPIAYWNFDEPVGATTLSDGDLDGGNVFDATYAGDGAPEYGEGILGGAWRGTGATNDFFNTADLTDLSGIIDLSISVWVNPSTTPGFDGIFVARSAETSLGGTVGNWGLNQQGTFIDSRVQTGPGGSNGTDTPENSLPVDTWTHVGYVYDSLNGENVVYINGAEVATTTGLPLDVNWTTGGSWLIGNDSCCGGREWAGLMDDLAIYNTFLTQTDFQNIYNNGLAGTALDGSTAPIPGDVDGDLDVDNADMDIILGALGTTVGDGMTNTRPLGDLTNDGFVGLADFRQWKDNFPTPGSVGSQGVPEPGAIALLASIGAIALGLRRRGVAVLIAAAAIGVSSADAQVVVTVDQDTGGVTVANPEFGVNDITFDFYQFGSANGLLSPGGWANFENVQLVAPWEVVISTPTTLIEAIGPTGAGDEVSTFPAEASPINFGTVLDNTALIAAQQAAGLGVDVRDITFEYSTESDPASGLDAATVVYTGDTITNNLVLKVAGDGTAVIENESPFNIEFDGLLITSAASLNPSWSGSSDLTGPDWESGPTLATAVSLVSRTSSVTADAAVAGEVQAGGTIDLGDIFVPGSEEDLVFRFVRVGEDDGDGFIGAVEYAAAAGLEGDYNDDGTVDAVDYAIWRENLGTSNVLPNDPTPGTVDASDLTVWQDNYGATAAVGSGAIATPEPAAVLIAALGIAGFATRRRV